MSEHETNIEEAKAQLASRLEDLGRFNQLSEDYEPGAIQETSFDDQAILETVGEPEEYGLSWEVDSISPRWGTVTYAYVISTGGPHEEFQITVEGDEVKRVTFVSLPWFDRVELELTPAEESIVRQFVDRFMYVDGYTDGRVL